MKKIIYINQGQAGITTNPKITLVTSGMTECIGVCIQSVDNPDFKALLHLDGDTMYSQEIANNNIAKIKNVMNQAQKYDKFIITAFGGRENAQNHRFLQNAIYQNFNKDKIKFYYKSIEGYNPIKDTLCITSNNNFGLFDDVMKKEKINLSQYTTEYQREINNNVPENHNMIIFDDFSIDEYCKKMQTNKSI